MAFAGLITSDGRGGGCGVPRVDIVGGLRQRGSSTHRTVATSSAAKSAMSERRREPVSHFLEASDASVSGGLSRAPDADECRRLTVWSWSAASHERRSLSTCAETPLYVNYE